jgi:hypothetical protein
MVPGWSERERQGLHAMRQEWIHANRRDGPATGVRASLHRVGMSRPSLAVSVMKAICWFSRHGLRLISLPSQIWALRTVGLLDQISRGGIQ